MLHDEKKRPEKCGGGVKNARSREYCRVIARIRTLDKRKASWRHRDDPGLDRQPEMETVIALLALGSVEIIVGN